MKFGVFKEIETYKKINGYNRYHYEYLIDSTLLKIFNSKRDAIDYCNSYNLSCEILSDAMYANILSVFKINEDNEIISDILYIKAYSYEELENILNIKIIIY